jgi:large subunit ribosomal protein L10
MPKTRTQKETTVATLADQLAKAKGMAFGRLAKHTVTADAELRRTARATNVRLTVVKKTLLARAATQAGLALDATKFTGTTVLALSLEDEVAPAKLLHTFGRTHPGVALVAAVAGGTVMVAADASRFATLPSITEIRGQLVSVIAGPLRGFVTVLAGPLRGLATVLTRRAESLPTAS